MVLLKPHIPLIYHEEFTRSIYGTARCNLLVPHTCRSCFLTSHTMLPSLTFLLFLYFFWVCLFFKVSNSVIKMSISSLVVLLVHTLWDVSFRLVLFIFLYIYIYFFPLLFPSSTFFFFFLVLPFLHLLFFLILILLYWVLPKHCSFFLLGTTLSKSTNVPW